MNHAKQDDGLSSEVVAKVIECTSKLDETVANVYKCIARRRAAREQVVLDAFDLGFHVSGVDSDVTRTYHAPASAVPQPQTLGPSATS